MSTHTCAYERGEHVRNDTSGMDDNDERYTYTQVAADTREGSAVVTDACAIAARVEQETSTTRWRRRMRDDDVIAGATATEGAHSDVDATIHDATVCNSVMECNAAMQTTSTREK